MGTLLLRRAHLLATMDGREISDGALFARDGWIEAVGPTSELPDSADEVVDLSCHVVIPGLVNTHHHLYQTLTRVIPEAQDAGLFEWLRVLYPIWGRMTPDHVRTSTRLGLVELALSGCTTVFDHHYLWPNGSRLDDQVEGASGVGLRVHLSRGSLSLGDSDGGLPPDSVVEPEPAILDDYARVVEMYHKADRGAMTRIVLAPCSPFSTTPELMRETAAVARDLDVTMHTHVAETVDEEDYCLDVHSLRPVMYLESLDWAGPDVWFAHAVHLVDEEIEHMGDSDTGVAHCPTSNMRLASGMAPVSRYLEAGVRVGLGVDGSASNDSSHMLAEVRQSLLLNRLGVAPGVGEGAQMSARTALQLATVGGASVLGRDDIGVLAPGYVAYVVAFDLNRIEFAGALHDPLAALVMCTPVSVDRSWVGGRPVVEGGRVSGIDVSPLIEEHNVLSTALME